MRAFLAALCVTLASLAAQAEDAVVGRWLLDEAAFRAQAERFYGEAILQLPAEQQAEGQALAAIAVDAAVEQMAGSTAEFDADGTVVLRPASGSPQNGTWTRDGETIRLEPAVDAVEAVSLVGELNDDGTLQLRPAQAGAVGFVMRRADP